MIVLAWIILGLSIGVAASRLSRNLAGAVALDIALGIVGVALAAAYRTIFRRDGF